MTSRAVAATTLTGKPAKSGPQLGREWANVLAEVPLFQGVSKRHLRKIADTAVAARFHPQTDIVRKGERGETFYVILDGEARVAAGRKSKNLGAGDFFGEMALLSGDVRSATVTAKSEVHVMRISRRRFLQMLEKDPKLAIVMLKALASRVQDAEGTTS